jgi:hypothetical protein
MKRLRIRLYEWLDRAALRLNEATLHLSRWALKRRALACGCVHCASRTDSRDEVAAVREMVRRALRDDGGRPAETGRVN